MLRGARVAMKPSMKPQLFVIGASRPLAPMHGMRNLSCHRPSATTQSQKFDYSPQELSSIIEWLALERRAI
jgi:hypothetical protein